MPRPMTHMPMGTRASGCAARVYDLADTGVEPRIAKLHIAQFPIGPRAGPC
jgi:hypothetical protein